MSVLARLAKLELRQRQAAPDRSWTENVYWSVCETEHFRQAEEFHRWIENSTDEYPPPHLSWCPTRSEWQATIAIWKKAGMDQA